jgi:acylphosphatase
MKKQIHAFFSGQVQGVGFRYTARDIAQSLNVCGWVRNLPDGKVEVLAQAEESALKIFVDEINSNFSGYITNSEIETSLPGENYKYFDIIV